MVDKHIVVIGGGPGGLTSAMILARRGFKVTLFEARDRVGGRSATLELGPYVFDTGPTFLMMKYILDQVFFEAGAACDRILDNRELEPMYRLAFDDRQMDISADHETMKCEIERCFPGHGHCLDDFFNQERKRFKRMLPCLQKSYHTLSSMLSQDLVRAAPYLAAGRSLFDVMHGLFKDEKLSLAFTFQAKYLGMSPWECPGLFAIIPYIEHAFGIYHPIGGLSRISEAMQEVAQNHGAEIRCDTPVKRILVTNGAARGVELEDGTKIEADDVVLNADFGHAVNNLFEPGVLRKYTPKAMERKRLSCSTFMLYLGLDKQYPLAHHTVFFAEDYRTNVEKVFRGEQPSDDLSFYVRNASITDDTLAPDGHSAVYVLAPVPNLRGDMDWNSATSHYRDVLLSLMEKRAGMADLRQHIREEQIVSPVDWRDTYRVYAGATFNLAHNLTQMIYLRPRNKFEEVDNCYLVGGGTHPGSGLPTIYESGRIAANLLSRKHGAIFTSGNLEV